MNHAISELNNLSALGQAFCFNARLYVLTRFLVLYSMSKPHDSFTNPSQMGVGSIIIICLGPVLLTELSHPRQRGALVATYSSFFYVGATGMFKCLRCPNYRLFSDLYHQHLLGSHMGAFIWKVSGVGVCQSLCRFCPLLYSSP